MARRIGDILVERGLITRDQLEQALAQQQESQKRLGQILVEQRLINSDDLVDAISERLLIPRVTLDNIVVDPNVRQLIPLELVKKHEVLPLFQLGETLTLAMVDPLDFIAVDEIRYLTKLRINRVVASHESLLAAIEENYSVKDSLNEALEDIARQQEETGDLVGGHTPEERVAGEGPVIKYVNLLITQAIKERASDIHIEPEEDSVRVRYRVSGLLDKQASPPKTVQAALVSRLKIMAGMDVSELRVPQDGRFTFVSGHIKVDVRVSTLPTIHGEKVVMRLLDRRNLLLGIDSLGLPIDVAEDFRSMVGSPEGLILISGPTGSGKTSTLYAVLDELNSPDKNVITVEDPVEYDLPGINQVQTNEKIDLSFAGCLRAILRQNPDIIMVGEIRDAETAAMAVRSAMTGHLVFSTIHTNDSAGAVTRLLDMGIESFLLASSLLGVVAQRLVRAICPACRITEEVPGELQRELEIPPGVQPVFSRGTGCETCGQTGYRGRTGVFEVLRVTDAIRNLILRNRSSGEIKARAVAHGMRTLHQEALRLALEGRTTYQEVLRVSHRAEEGALVGGNVESVHV